VIKVSVIGAAGCVGSSIAFNIARQGLADEIMVADIRRDWLEHHAIDFYDAAVANNVDTCVNMGTHADLADSDIVVMAAGIPVNRKANPDERALPSRQRLLPEGLELVREWAPAIDRHCPHAVVVMVTNPADTLNYAAFLLSTGRERRRFIGYSLNDTIRFKIALAGAMRVEPSRLEAAVIGEHGGTMVPLFSSVRLDAKPVALDETVKARVLERTNDYLPHMLRLKVPRTSGWLTGVGVARTVNAVLNDTGEVFPCCAVLEGEYGHCGTSLGVPVVLGEGGIREIIEYPLTPEERELLDRSAQNIRQSIDYIEGQLR
jgi:malate/lactate dehydrogenase